MDDFFSESKPDLINKKTMHSFEKMLKPRHPAIIEPTMSDSLAGFYDEYIKPNGFFIIVLVLLILFLVYRYMTKSTEEFRPTFNPNYPIQQQYSYTNYLPDTIPLNINGEYVTHNDIYPKNNPSEIYTTIQDPFGISRRTYTGINNTYSGALDPMMPNSLGLDPNYNTTTEQSIKYMVGKNRRDLDILAEILFNKSYPDNDNGNRNNENLHNYCKYSDFNRGY